MDIKITRCIEEPYKLYFTLCGRRYFIKEVIDGYESYFFLFRRNVLPSGNFASVESIASLTREEERVAIAIIKGSKQGVTYKDKSYMLASLISNMVRRGVVL